MLLSCGFVNVVVNFGVGVGVMLLTERHPKASDICSKQRVSYALYKSVFSKGKATYCDIESLINCFEALKDQQISVDILNSIDFIYFKHI